MLELKGHKGFSLIELLIVIGLISILLAIAMPAFWTWMVKYDVEAQVRKLYGDLTTARAQAMYRNRTHCFTIIAANYQVVADMNNNGCADDAVILNVNAHTPFLTSAGGFSFGFDSRGIARQPDGLTAVASEAICVPSTASPDFDCIRIEQARMQLGKMTVQGGGCNAVICREK
jgi:prepilin-type N-terminal cleavage/methylation domain-containing protein